MAMDRVNDVLLVSRINIALSDKIKHRYIVLTSRTGHAYYLNQIVFNVSNFPAVIFSNTL